ncbi:MAG: restriction endonuclease subunit S [Paludibacteraceae bacterium]|nr:restriction endonuclease subunit S [Paludibacteraceae bacterium]
MLNTEVSPEYTTPVYSANVFEPFGMIDKLLITDFSKDSVIWGIDGDWMVNTIPANVPFYPTDHCGVLRIKTDDVLPKYMAYLLQKEGERVGFSRTYRASIDRIEGLNVNVAPVEMQRKAVAQVEQYEAAIRQAQAIMDGCAARKKAILDKYLN